MPRPENNSTGAVLDNLATGKRSLWDVSEVARFFKVSERTVRDWVYKRKVPYRKAGNCLRFDPEELERWALPKKE